MASMYVQNKRGREEFWNGGFGLPEGKRMNIGHDDTDLMALLDRIDNFDYIEKDSTINDSGVVINEVEEENQEERLKIVIKSLEDEIGLEQPNDENVDKNVACVDNVGPVARGDAEKKDVEEKLYYETAATPVAEMAAQLENLYYDEDSGFFMDHPATSADELGIMIMRHCNPADYSMAGVFMDSLYGGYADNTEAFYGSLWEDDIWHVNDHGSLSSSNTKEPVLQRERFL